MTFFQQQSRRIINQFKSYQPPIFGSSSRWGLGTSFIKSRTEVEHAVKNLAFSCIKKRANIAAKWKYQVFKMQSQTNMVELPLNHWAVDLLNNPSDYWVRSEIYKLVSEWLDANGNAFVLTPKHDGLPVAFWVLDPRTVSIVTGKDQLIVKYVVSTPTGKFDVPPDEMLHFRELSIGEGSKSTIIGSSLVASALDSLEDDQYVHKYIQNLFSNMAQPPLILESQGEYDDTKWKLFKQTWDEKNPNHKLTGLLENGTKIANISSSPLSVSLAELDRATQQKIAIAFETPLAILSGEWTNRATADTQIAHFMGETMQARVDYMSEVFSQAFRIAEPGILVMSEKYKYVDPEQERAQEAHEIEHGIITINDARKIRGGKTIDGGDEPLVASGLISLKQALNPQPAMNPNSGAPKPQPPTKSVFKDITVEDASLAYWKTYDDIGSAYTTKYQRAIAKEYQPLFDELMKKSVSKSFGEMKGLEDVDVSAWKILLKDKFKSLVEDNSWAIIEQVLNDVNDSLENASADFDGLVANAVEESVSKITDPVDTIIQDVKNIAKSNATLPTSELTSLLQKEFDYYKSNGWKAQRIARTTGTFVTGSSQTVVIDDFKLDSFWLSQRDGKQRPTHKLADGKRPNEQGLYKIGDDSMRHPAGGSLAEENIHCRCVLFASPKKKAFLRNFAKLSLARENVVIILASYFSGGQR
jgi:HK97 family phage portal protein